MSTPFIASQSQTVTLGYWGTISNMFEPTLSSPITRPAELVRLWILCKNSRLTHDSAYWNAEQMPMITYKHRWISWFLRISSVGGRYKNIKITNCRHIGLPVLINKKLNPVINRQQWLSTRPTNRPKVCDRSTMKIARCRTSKVKHPIAK